MAFEFFTTQQGNNSQLNDLSAKIGARGNAASKRNIESFKATKAVTNSTESQKQFADFLESVKKRNATQQSGQSQEVQKAVPLEVFTNTKTEIPALHILSEDLQALIDEYASTGLITTQEGDEEKQSLQALLDGIVSQIIGREPATDDSSTLTDDVLPENQDDLLTILGGMSPQEITELKTQIHDYILDELSAEDQAALAALISQFYALTQPESSKTEKSADRANAISDNVLKTDLKATPNNNTAQSEHHTQGRYDARFDARYEGNNAAPQSDAAEETFDTALKGAPAKDAPTPQNHKAQISSGQQFLQGNTALSSTISTLEGALPQSGFTITSPSTPLQSALTNITTQAQSAGQNHPATQMVSMTIQKAVKAGDDTNIKLRLDPPDLGRVEVKMSVDKDSASKIVLTAEKPETFLMLQRDSDALHRALADAGLDMNGDIGFELAGDDHDFNREDAQDRGKSSSGEQNEDEQITQSTVDWHVDPDTGRTRYNIVV